MAIKLLSNTIAIKKAVDGNGYSGKPITETISNGFFRVNREWTVLYWNMAAEKILGISARDIVGKNLWDKSSSVLPLDFCAVYHKAFLKNIPIHFEEYWGEMGAWFDVVAYHCDDTLSISFKSGMDRTHPLFPEEQLKTLTELYRFVTEVTNDCLWEWNLQTKEQFWIDGGHKRVFGFQMENALVPQSFWEDRLHSDDKVRVLAKLNRLIADGSSPVWEDEYRFKKASGDYASVQDRGYIIFDQDKAASRMIGATQDITARKLLEIKLVQEGVTKQKEISTAVLKAQQGEREDIGKELHDNLNQILVATKLYIEMARTHKGKKDEYLKKSSGYIMDVIEELRKISKVLVTPDMNMGLIESIQNLVADLNAVHPMIIKFHHEGIVEADLNEKMQLDIYRIVQEQLTNILKHAKATTTTINLTKDVNDIIVLFSDNGKGCDILKQTNGVGIINIKSRAKIYGGRVAIVSKPEEGYELKVVLPLKSNFK